MVDFDTAMPIYQQLSNYSEDLLYRAVGDELAKTIGAAAAFAVEGSRIDVADIEVTTDDDDDLESVAIVILTADRLVAISHEAAGVVKTIIRSRAAIRSVELLKVPNVLADRNWGRNGSLAVRITLTTGEMYELGDHDPTAKMQEDLRAALPTLLGGLAAL